MFDHCTGDVGEPSNALGIRFLIIEGDALSIITYDQPEDGAFLRPMILAYFCFIIFDCLAAGVSIEPGDDGGSVAEEGLCHYPLYTRPLIIACPSIITTT